jgi:hypothetical protein
MVTGGQLPAHPQSGGVGGSRGFAASGVMAQAVDNFLPNWLTKVPSW